jgi:uncharacterized SAM-binding protein YcdF (DUF218 family)
MPKLLARLLHSKKVRILLGLAALAAILLFVFRDRWRLALGDYLIVRDDLRPADVIHVIGGDDYRTDYAIRLYKQGLGKTIFFTVGWCQKHQYHHGEHGRERSMAQGVPSDAIAYDSASVTSTYSEAERLKAWIARSPVPIRSVIVVSDPFHMRRARWAFKRVLGKTVEVRMAPVPFEMTNLQRRWWTDWRGRYYVRDEYEKLVYYVLRYQIARGKVRDWLAAMDKE